MENNLIFVTGGARSGKSSFAEEYAAKLAYEKNKRLYYIATSKQEDKEMEDRIERHQIDRQKSGHTWETVECATDLAKAALLIESNSVAVIDCLTILLTNELFRDGFDHQPWEEEKFLQDVLGIIKEGINTLTRQLDTCILVSNEVTFETMAKGTSIVHAYMKCIGILHQYIVKQAKEAYLVEAGIPIRMKGDL